VRFYGSMVMQQVKFNELPLTDKALLIAEFGNYLESIEFYDYWIHLYALHSHFIEIYYNIHTRQIDKISLVDYCDLDKYLNRIVLTNVSRSK
jgi:hypothetical protein